VFDKFVGRSKKTSLSFQILLLVNACVKRT